MLEDRNRFCNLTTAIDLGTEKVCDSVITWIEARQSEHNTNPNSEAPSWVKGGSPATYKTIALVWQAVPESLKSLADSVRDPTLQPGRQDISNRDTDGWAFGITNVTCEDGHNSGTGPTIKFHAEVEAHRFGGDISGPQRENLTKGTFVCLTLGDS